MSLTPEQKAEFRRIVAAKKARGEITVERTPRPVPRPRQPAILTPEQSLERWKQRNETRQKNREAGLCRCGRKPLRNLTRCEQCLPNR